MKADDSGNPFLSLFQNLSWFEHTLDSTTVSSGRFRKQYKRRRWRHSPASLVTTRPEAVSAHPTITVSSFTNSIVSQIRYSPIAAASLQFRSATKTAKADSLATNCKLIPTKTISQISECRQCQRVRSCSSRQALSVRFLGFVKEFILT